jgi:hypothetical protein
MSDPSYSLVNLFWMFIVLSAFYAVPVGLLFLLRKRLSSESPSPYTGQALWSLCLPGFLYALLETIAERQGLNILMTVPIIVIAGIIATLLFRRINLNVWVFIGCTLAMLLWWLVPNGSLKLF